MGGETSPAGAVNVLEYVTIDTTGNMADFGDLPAVKHSISGNKASDSHGGL